MKVLLQAKLSDPHLDSNVGSSQRQIEVSIAAEQMSEQVNSAPLNLCLVLDHSGSMSGRPMETVKQAAIELVDKLSPNDRISVIAFDHQAKVIVPNQTASNVNSIKEQISQLKPAEGTAIDEGMKLGLQEAAVGKQDRISQLFLLTDGENEHGDNQRCLSLAQLAPQYNITLSALGFGAHWNQDILEKIADSAGGTLSYIEKPEQAVAEFAKLFTRIQSVSLTNAHLLLEFIPQIRLAELKPIAQVAPETVELIQTYEEPAWSVRLGDLMIGTSRQILVNLYISKLPPGLQSIGSVVVRYDDPATGQVGLLSEKIPLTVEVQDNYKAEPEPQVQKSVLTLTKYRQTQLAETKLQQGDRVGAVTLLKTAAKTALQLGDDKAATVLQNSATRLQAGDELTEEERKKTRLASKTSLQVSNYQDNIAKNTSETTLTSQIKAQWILLSFLPSSLLLGVTTYITTNLTTLPFLWAIPLAIYLSSFFFTFFNKTKLPKKNLEKILLLLLTLLIVLSLLKISQPVWLLLTLHLLGFLGIASVFHRQLARSRPHPKYLKSFYFWIFLGVVLGGLFNAIVSLLLFPNVLGYSLLLGVTLLLLGISFFQRLKQKAE